MNQRIASAAHTATLVGADLPLGQYGGCWLTAILDVTAVPGTDTVQLVIEGKDPQSGKYYTLLSAAARSTAGTDVLTIGPGVATVANVSAAGVVPSIYRTRVVHSAGTSFTYSLSSSET